MSRTGVSDVDEITALIHEYAFRLDHGDLDGVDGLYAALDAVPQAGGALALTLVRGTEEREVEVSFESREEAA